METAPENPTPEKIEKIPLMAAFFDPAFEEEIEKIDLGDLNPDQDLDIEEDEPEPEREETVTGETKAEIPKKEIEADKLEAEKAQLKEKITEEVAQIFTKADAQDFAESIAQAYGFAINGGANLIAKNPFKDWEKEFKFTKEQLKKLENAIAKVLLYYYKTDPLSPLYSMLAVMFAMTAPMGWAAFLKRKENLALEAKEAELAAKTAEFDQLKKDSETKAAQSAAYIAELEKQAAERKFQNLENFEATTNVKQNMNGNNGNSSYTSASNPLEVSKPSKENENGRLNLRDPKNRGLIPKIKERVIQLYLKNEYRQAEIAEICNITESAVYRYIEQYETLKKAGKLETKKQKA